MRTPRWLVASVVGIVSTTAALSVAWVGICSFYVGPKIFQASIEGTLKQEPKVCDNVEDRAIQVLTGLLATLLGLMSNTPPDPKP
jgi:hypothetical protein